MSARNAGSVCPEARPGDARESAHYTNKTYTHTHTHLNVHTCVDRYVCIYIYTYIHIDLYTQARDRKHASSYSYI